LGIAFAFRLGAGQFAGVHFQHRFKDLYVKRRHSNLLSHYLGHDGFVSPSISPDERIGS
jgi:hypothetical protein